MTLDLEAEDLPPRPDLLEPDLDDDEPLPWLVFPELGLDRFSGGGLAEVEASTCFTGSLISSVENNSKKKKIKKIPDN